DRLDAVRVGDADDVVRRDLLRLLEPPGREAIEHLSLERQRADDAVEGADAVGDDDEAPAILRRVVVADLAFVLAAEGIEVGPLEGLGQSFAENGVGDGHGGPPKGGKSGGAEGSTDLPVALVAFALALGGRLASSGATLAG